ncbi:hypothetical protein MUU48_16750 [Scandinavium sp. H11S7]|uniref:hypothetical protein n=1 Tax=Scandinavium hiltneri TaxID=2926519 RepID=UPI0021669E78|nr:hypothetical protein [Scandinavium hiltneri]MCS2158541.1 hypothetical protein [Scandinavium hiltneri]
MNKHINYAAVVLLLFSANSFAISDSVTVDITANIKETTCDISLSAQNLQGANAITFGSDADGRVIDEDVINATGSALTKFSLNIDGCPAGLSTIKTRFSGTTRAGDPTWLMGDSYNVGVALYREGEETTLFHINSSIDSEILVWRPDEIQNKKANLMARLLQVGEVRYGNHRFPMTMLFSYE